MAAVNLFGISPCRFQMRPDDCADLAGSAGDTNKKPIKVAVITPKAGGAPNTAIGRVIASLIADRLFTWDNLSIISQDDIATMIGFEKLKMMMGCDDETCITEIAGALNVDFIVTGNIDILGDSYVGSFQLIDIRRAQVKARAPFRSPKNKEKEPELMRNINEAVDQLATPFFQKKGASLFAWAKPIWQGITERPYRSLMWTSFAASVGGLVVGGVSLGNARDVENQYTGLVNRLRSDGKIVGQPGNYHFTDDAAKTANVGQIDELRQSAETQSTISTGGFVGAAVFAGLGILLWHFDSNGQNQKTGTKVAVQLFEGGTQINLGGTF